MGHPHTIGRQLLLIVAIAGLIPAAASGLAAGAARLLDAGPREAPAVAATEGESAPTLRND